MSTTYKYHATRYCLRILKGGLSVLRRLIHRFARNHTTGIPRLLETTTVAAEGLYGGMKA